MPYPLPGQRAFIWDEGSGLLELEQLPGGDSARSAFGVNDDGLVAGSAVYALNNAGQIAGTTTAAGIRSAIDSCRCETAVPPGIPR